MKNYNSVTKAMLDYYNGKLSKDDFNKLYPKCRFKYITHNKKNKIMNKEEIKEYFILLNQYKNCYHLTNNDKQELIRLNHLIMEDAHMIHNANMMNRI